MRTPRTEAARTLTVMSDLAELTKVREFVKQSLRALPFSDQDAFNADLALVEVFTNIIRHAYRDERGVVHLAAWQDRGGVYFEVRDSGVPFDPRRKKKPRLKRLIRAEKKGGFGIYLTRRLMDSYSYRREEGQNILTLFKKPGRSVPQ